MMRLLVLPLLLLLGFAAGYLLGRRAIDSPDPARISQLESENRELRSKLEGLSAGNARLSEPSNAPDDTRAVAKPGSRSKAETRYVEDTQATRSLQEALTSAKQSAMEWESRASELQNQLDQLKEDNQRLIASAENLREQLASSMRSAEQVQASLRSKDERLFQLEAANRKLRDESMDANQKAKSVAQVSGELQEIHRRRESYLTSLVNRYREVTEQYRAFASVLDNRRGPEGTSSPAGSVGGPELARIQNTIALADEDLRQLNTLNSQALRIQKQLAGK